MAGFRSPHAFLKIGGAVLVLVGVLGFFLIGPTADSSIFGSAWVFTMAENWAHLILGIVALVAAGALKDHGQAKALVIVVGLVALLVGILGFFNSLGNILQNPLDNILHLVVGIWALWAAMGGASAAGAAPRQPAA